MIRQQHRWDTIPRNLYRSTHHRFGRDRQRTILRQRRTVKAHTHPVIGVRDLEPMCVKLRQCTFGEVLILETDKLDYINDMLDRLDVMERIEAILPSTLSRP